MRKFIFFLFLYMLMLSVISYPLYAAGAVKLKMTVANPSASEIKTVPVKTYLPKGITPEDITDKGKFQIGYDFDKSLYYAYQEVKLNPNESLTLELSMQDIWNIPIDEINSLKEHTQKVVNSLKNAVSYSQAKILEESIISRLDKITEIQASADANIEEKIANYGANNDILKEVKKDISVLDDLAMEIGVPGEIEAAGLMGETVSSTEPVKIKYTDLDIKTLGSVKFRIALSNPSDKEAAIPLKYYLPVEVKPEYIVDKGGLDVGYDYQKDIHYVYKDTLTLAAREKKEFIVEVKNIWIIPQQQIDVLRAQTARLMGILGESEYKLAAKSLADKIISFLDNIMNVQNKTDVSVERHIGDFRENLKKFEEAKKDIAKLEKLAVQTGGSAGVTLAGNEEPQAVSHKSQLKGSAGSGITRGAKGIELVSKSIFRGKAPDVTTSWKIIWIIIGFLAVVSFLFFILWWTQIKVGAGKKHEEVKQDEKK